MPAQPRLLSVCLNPVLQKTLVLPHLRENEVNRSSEYYSDASGKGLNVVRVLTQLGEQAQLLTQAGGRQRERFLALAEADGIALTWVESGSEIRTCTTLLNQERATCTEIVEEAAAVEPATEARVRAAYTTLLADHSTVVFSGTKAAGFSNELYPELVEQARAAGATVILDVRGSDLTRSLQHSPDVIKPNYAEFVATFLTSVMPTEHARDAALDEPVREKMRSLAREHRCAVVLTHGTAPTLFIGAGRSHVSELAVDAARAVNTIGSGDAFTAGLAAALAHGAMLEVAVAQGQACGRENARLLRPGVIR